MTVRLIVFTFAALSLVNAYSFVKLYSSTTVSTNRVLVSASSPLRKPAAISPQATQIPTQNLDSRVVYDLNCGDRRKPSKRMLAQSSPIQRINGSWVQLKGRLCNGNKLKLVEITNLSNGFTASILNMGNKDKEYRTDLIQLYEGDNKIRVRLTPFKGDVEEQTLIVVGQSN